MEDLGAFRDGMTALPGQSNLIRSLWDNAALDSNSGLNSFISTIRSMGGRGAFKPEPDLLSISSTQLNQTLDQPETVSRSTPTKILETNRLFSQPFFGSTTAGTDSVTGTTAGAPLVGAQAISPTRINFQPNDAPVPGGHIKDIGQAYNATRGYGWVRQDSLSNATHTRLDITENARERNRAGVDQRLDTLIHMQLPNTTAAAWEYAVPDGQYSVTVSVGDQPKYNSTHQINIEGETAIRPFKGNSIHEYERSTVQVEVSDGRLTVDAIGGSNTKINYVEIKSVSPGEHPNVAAGTAPFSRQTNVNRSAAVSLNVALVSPGAGVNSDTLTPSTIRLYRTIDNVSVLAGSIGTSGGGDAIVYQPREPLAANTHYTFRLGDGVKDDDGRTFLPFSTTFSTGTSIDEPPPGVNFNKSTQFSGASVSSLVMSPDGSKLYATDLGGEIRRWTVSGSGNLTSAQVLSLPQLAGRAIVGIAFDPANSNVLWISHNAPLFPQPAEDFTGKISKLTLQSGSGFNASLQDYVVGLPRSAKDHLSNSLAFKNGMLYMTQGSNTAMGAPDTAWGPRGERLLTAAVLQIDPRRTPPSGGFNVKTQGRGAANYNPFAANAPVKLFATGVRNAYDLVWHSDGSLYVPTNGSAAKGNTPDDPTTSVDEGLTNVAVQNDYLFKVVENGYYGHPNPKRQEYIMNGGNPTSERDPAEVVDEGPYNGYTVGTDPDSNYRGFAHDFGRNRSPNGAIEYKSNTFGGILKNRLLVAEYSGGDRILSLSLNAQGQVTETTPVYSDLINPVDLIENTSNGNLYVAELVDEKTGEGRITLLKPASRAGAPNITESKTRLIFSNAQGGVPSAAQIVRFRNTGDGDLNISGLKLSGTNANQFQINNPLTVPLTIAPGGSASVSIAFNPTTIGPKGSLLQIQSNDPDTPLTTITLRGLGTLGVGGSKEPSLQWILDTYQIPNDVGDPNPRDSAMPATTSLGDEVSLPRFQRAGLGPVTVEPIAVFGPRDSTSGIVTRFGYYTSGNVASKQQLFSIPNANHQSLNPGASGSQSFNPGTSSFGFYSSWPIFNNRAVYSEDKFNTFDATVPHHVRVYPFKNPDGTIEANTYILATEGTTGAYDYQDIVVVVRNVQPVPPSSARTHADFNGDSRTDILWRNRATGENLVWLMQGTNFSAAASLPIVRNPNWLIGGPR